MLRKLIAHVESALHGYTTDKVLAAIKAELAAGDATAERPLGVRSAAAPRLR